MSHAKRRVQQRGDGTNREGVDDGRVAVAGTRYLKSEPWLEPAHDPMKMKVRENDQKGMETTQVAEVSATTRGFRLGGAPGSVEGLGRFELQKC